jgi:hypothetical protein
MADVHCFTSISFSYLSRARVLAETIKKYHPDWTLWLGICDVEPPGFSLDAVPHGFDHVLWAKDLKIDGIQAWMFKHNVVEMCTAVK